MPVFLRIEGIDGESTSEQHAGWHDVFSFSWGCSNAVSPGAGGGGGAGRSTFSDLNVVKPSGKGSPGLMVFCAQGRHLPAVQLEVTRYSGEREVVVQRYELQDCSISSFQVAGDGDSAPTESLSLNFTKIVYRQSYMLADGSVRTQFGNWDIRRSTGGWTP